jgi:hypothetical protein
VRNAAWISVGAVPNRPSLPAPSRSISTRPSCVDASIKPAVTVLPVPSTTVAPAGGATVPTSAILPSRITSVARSSFLSARWYTVAFVIAIVSA